MTNHVAKLIKNEKSIKKNFIDEFIWREDEHFEYSIGNEPVSLKIRDFYNNPKVRSTTRIQLSTKLT